MDAHRRLNPNEGDAALRELFRESGHSTAPDGMEARILQRLAVMPVPVHPAEPALVPKWMWFGAGALMLACIGSLLSQPEAGTGIVQRYVPPMPELPFQVLTSGWFMMAVACGLVLLAADTLLSRRAAQ